MIAELLFNHQFLVSGALLLGSVLATIAVGYGIILETPENPNARERRAVRFVIIGVVLETVCTVGLFAFDEAVMSTQGTDIQTLSGITKTAEEAAGTAVAEAKRVDKKIVVMAAELNAEKTELGIVAATQPTLRSEMEKLEHQRSTQVATTEAANAADTEAATIVRKDNPKSPLRPFADLPVFISAAADSDSQNLRKEIASVVKAGTGKQPQFLPAYESDRIPGVRVAVADPVPTGGAALEYFDVLRSMTRSNAFAQAICTEIVGANVSDRGVRTDFDFVQPDSKTFKPPWIATVPLQGVLINVGRILPGSAGSTDCANPG